MNRKCENCLFEIDPLWGYCPQCGNEIIKCPKCKSDNNEIIDVEINGNGLKEPKLKCVCGNVFDF